MVIIVIKTAKINFVMSLLAPTLFPPQSAAEAKQSKKIPSLCLFCPLGASGFGLVGGE